MSKVFENYDGGNGRKAVLNDSVVIIGIGKSEPLRDMTGIIGGFSSYGMAIILLDEDLDDGTFLVTVPVPALDLIWNEENIND